MSPYRHILVATDGTPRSQRAIHRAVQLARALGARLTGVHVVPAGVPTLFTGRTLYGSGVLGQRYRDTVRRQSKAATDEVLSQASSHGVRCGVLHRLAREPARAILSVAHEEGCDLIVMASRGRSRTRSLLLGSETSKVLAHSRIPVLVCR